MKLKEGYEVDDIKECVMKVPEIKDVQIIAPGEKTSKSEYGQKSEQKEEKKDNNTSSSIPILSNP